MACHASLIIYVAIDCRRSMNWKLFAIAVYTIVYIFSLAILYIFSLVYSRFQFLIRKSEFNARLHAWLHPRRHRVSVEANHVIWPLFTSVYNSKWALINMKLWPDWKACLLHSFDYVAPTSWRRCSALQSQNVYITFWRSTLAQWLTPFVLTEFYSLWLAPAQSRKRTDRGFLFGLTF